MAVKYFKDVAIERQQVHSGLMCCVRIGKSKRNCRVGNAALADNGKLYCHIHHPECVFQSQSPIRSAQWHKHKRTRSQ